MLRVFIMAGQHGDESDAREAAAHYLAGFESGPSKSVHLAVLIDGNPDGAAAGKRRNASDIDLNRDHLLLNTTETLAVHSFVDRWRPDLIVDVHTYRPRRRELLQHGLVFPQEVMVDFPTNPAVSLGLPDGTEISLLNFVKHRMAEASVQCDRYTLVRPSGIVRHSNLDIVDARNGLALRYGILTVLLEGRRWSPDDPPIFGPPHLPLLGSIEAVVEWADRNAFLIRQRPEARPLSDHRLPVRCRYTNSETPTRFMKMQSASLGDINFVGIPGAYLPVVRTTKSIWAPRAYAVPREAIGLLAVLARQGFETTPPNDYGRAEVDFYRVPDNESTLSWPDPANPSIYTVERTRLNPDDYILFPTSQSGGRALALFLEPESRFGAHRFSGLGLTFQPGTLYPVGRVVMKKA